MARLFMFLIILIIILILVIIINKSKYNNISKIEHYNARIKNTDLNKCAEFCKTTDSCFGFGYDKNKKICYPSKSTITTQPVDNDVLYRDEYSPNNPSCNKLEPVILANWPSSYFTGSVKEDVNKIPFDQRRKNSIYVCKENETFQPQWYLHSNNTFTNLGEGKNIDELFDIDEYIIKPYNWPIDKYNTDQLDLLAQDRLNQSYTYNNITQLKRMLVPDENTDENILPVLPIEKQTVRLDFGLENIKKWIFK
jgi:hypothetical protein